MGAHEHRDAARDLRAVAEVIVVSSTRTLDDDTSGRLIGALLEGAGHGVARTSLVDDDAEAIRAAVRRAVDDGEVDVVVLTGGTGLSARDVTPEAIAPLLTRRIPGFGELFRMLSFKEVGAASMLSRALAGFAGRTPVFALPGSSAGCRLAVEELILPELAHLLHQARKEAPAEPVASSPPPAAPRPPPPARPTVGQLGERSAPAAAVKEEDGAGLQRAAAWLGALEQLGGTVIRGTWPELPRAVERLAPVMNVLSQAGERGELSLPGGRRYALFGFPDLEDVASKVLAVGAAEPVAEIVALHRHPTPTGTCVAGLHALLPHRHELAETCEAVTGRAPRDRSGEVFAVQGDAVFIERGGRIWSWDGRKERDEGKASQVLSSLVLRWSGR